MRDDLNDDIEDVDAEFLEDEEESGLLRWLSILVVLLTIAGFLALAWYANNAGTETSALEDVPLVTAEDGSFKEAPKDPGGLHIPHQDKTIYDAIGGSGVQKPAAERLMPAPEEPVINAGQTETWINKSLHPESPEAEASAQVADAAPAPVRAGELAPLYAPPATTAPAEEVAAPVTPKVIHIPATEEVAAEEVAVVEPAPVEAPKPAPVVEAKKEEPVAKPVEAAPVAAKPSSGSGKVQLGAYKSDAEAQSEWKRLQKKFSELSGRSHMVEKADLGSKGVFYRLQVTGLADAKALCDSLTPKGQGCMVKSK